jgi:DHA1 family tetracycline resistance protein-like MFS transporter
MERKIYKPSTLYTALLVAFIDFFGVGLIYPLFSSMLFDSSYALLPAETTPVVRGIWLGFLIAVMPLAQFFSAPMWGALSDSRGRKKPLQLSLAIVLFGYIVAVGGVLVNSILLILASRIIIGIASGNTSIVQAAVADLSSPSEKTKNFGLYGMALGIGFTLGPFFGGLLSTYGYSIPFLLAAVITATNLVFTFLFFEETHHDRVKQKISPGMALTHLKKAFQLPDIRTILIVSFLHNFGWSYFFEFAPVYLITRFQFSSVQLGLFYGVAGGMYALCTGLLIRPFLPRFKPETLFVAGIFFTALAIYTLPFLPSIIWLWPVIFVMCFFVSFVAPTCITMISNSGNEKEQGEVMGNLSAVNAAAFMMSPLFSGSLVGAFPSMPIWLGGFVMILGSFLMLALLRSNLAKKA